MWPEAAPRRACRGCGVLAALAPLDSGSALERRLAAIGHAHRLRGLEWSAGHPAIRATLRGIDRTHRRRSRQAAALTSTEPKRLVAACGGDLTGVGTAPCCCRGFLGADWTPGPALVALRTRWPDLRFDLRPPDDGP